VAIGAYVVWRMGDRPPEEIGVLPAVSISAAPAALKDVPVFARGLGTVQAFNTVNVKSRVDGQITKVFFTEGQEVKAGDPLFEIDPRPFQATLDRASAAKERDEAQLEGAQRDLDRYGKLLPRGWQTRQSYEDQEATVGQLRGSIKADQAQIDMAQLNMEYATVRSPLSGRTGARLVDIGNFIQVAQGTPLVTITQMQPIFVNFTVTQDVLERVRQGHAKAPLKVMAFSNDDRNMLAEGTLTLIDNQVDASTGTVVMKANFPNTDERLWPGELVSARVILATREDVLTVPAEAVLEGASGHYVYTVKPDQTVEHRPVEVAQTEGGLVVIEKGLSAGESVVVDGQTRLTDGSRIKLGRGKEEKQARSQ
jgi:multidrug efflux system membrane fusion protein